MLLAGLAECSGHGTGPEIKGEASRKLSPFIKFSILASLDRYAVPSSSKGSSEAVHKTLPDLTRVVKSEASTTL